jgi:hypothetical protein
MKITNIDDISWNEIEAVVNSKPLIFVGSAISMFSPTNLLSGMNFCEKMYDYIFFDTKYRDKKYLWLMNEFNNIPFEALMECFPYKEKLPEIINSIFQVDRFNPIHKCIAERLVSGILHGIITPNYDLAFDSILKDLSYTEIVRDENDYRQWLHEKEKSCYFKIHGTSENNYLDTLIFTLSQEGTLKDWKIDLLKDLLSEKILIIIGYSGRDFDICPLIAKMNNYRKILWIHDSNSNNTNPEADLTAYAEYLLKQRNDNELIVGDFKKFTRLFFKEELDLNIEKINFIPSSHFKLSDDEISEWQLNILNRIACASIGIPLIKSLNEKVNIKKLTYLLSEMYGHTGEYFKAAKTSLELSKLYPKSSKEHILALSSVSRFWLYYGNYFKSCQYLSRAKNLKNQFYPNDDEVNTPLLNHELSFWMRMNQIFKLKLFFPIRYFILKSSKRISLSAQKLDGSGLWDERQTIQHNLERLNLEKESSLSLPSYKGYKNLGLPGMAIIAYRDKIRYNKWDSNEIKLDKLQECMDKAEALGMHTELWKLCRIKLKYCVLQQDMKKAIWNKWKQNLKITEYHFTRHLLMRLDLYWSYLKM